MRKPSTHRCALIPRALRFVATIGRRRQLRRLRSNVDWVAEARNASSLDVQH